MEVKGEKDLYSDYANVNLQEFWAESEELFFEKPSELNNHYPHVYEALKLLLNQDPVNKSNPIFKTDLSFNQKLKRIIHFLRIRTVKRGQLN